MHHDKMQELQDCEEQRERSQHGPRRSQPGEALGLEGRGAPRMSEVTESGAVILDTPEDIDFYVLLVHRGRLKMEILGITFRQSTLASCQRHGWTTKRTKKAALADLEALIEKIQKEREEKK
jgi:hypothetical protein